MPPKKDILNVEEKSSKHLNQPTKFIVVTGGVCSSLGKGISISSIGALLRSDGYNITACKIDPYLNVDASLMSPFEHGEVFVLHDGGQTDLDLGNYERWMALNLERDHNITTGKVMEAVVRRERAGQYLGSTVQMIPHVTDEVECRIVDLCNRSKAEICLIELGGTIGDIESDIFVETIRRMRQKFGADSVCLVHTTYLPTFQHTQKTKPTQHSVRALLGRGLVPDFLICRSDRPVDDKVKGKLSVQCAVPKEHIISAPNVRCLYDIPITFADQGLISHLKKTLKLRTNTTECNDVPNYEMYKKFSSVLLGNGKKVKIAFVGKYVEGGAEAYFSVFQALEHCQLNLGVQLEIVFLDAVDFVDGKKAIEMKEMLLTCDGMYLAGGFGSRGIEGMITAVKIVREHNIPFFGVCLGMQIALIEAARHLLHWEDATSEEFDASSQHCVVHMMPNTRKSTEEEMFEMYIGARQARILKKGSLMSQMYSGAEVVEERHRHRFEVNNKFIETFEKVGITVSAISESLGDTRVEAIESSELRFFFAVQFHPEFISTPVDPSPPYLAFVAAAAKLPVKWPSTCHPRRLPKKN